MAAMFFAAGKPDWIRRLGARDWMKITVAAIFGVVNVQLLQAWSLLHTSANHAGWLVGTMPMIVAAMTALFMGERIGKLRSLGFLLGFAGVLSVVLSRQQGAGGIMLPTGLGDAIFMGSAVCWSIYVLLTASWFKDKPQPGIILLQMTISFLLVAPVAIWHGGAGEVLRLSAHGWLAAAYLGFLSSGLGYYFWNNGVEKLGASATAAFLYVEPLAGQASAALLLDETISPYTALGGLVIMCGVYWVNGGRAGARTLKKVYNVAAG
jgi:drug/metabolite transporter (DMT)-like permease